MKRITGHSIRHGSHFMLFSILETIETEKVRHVIGLVEASGYGNSTCWNAVYLLKTCGLITTIGNYALTEQGKIALALLRGKQKRRNARRQYVASVRSGMGPRAAESSCPGH